MNIPYEIGQKVYYIDFGQVVEDTIAKIIIENENEILLKLTEGYTITAEKTNKSPQELIDELENFEKYRHEGEMERFKKLREEYKSQ